MSPGPGAQRRRPAVCSACSYWLASLLGSADVACPHDSSLALSWRTARCTAHRCVPPRQHASRQGSPAKKIIKNKKAMPPRISGLDDKEGCNLAPQALMKGASTSLKCQSGRSSAPPPCPQSRSRCSRPLVLRRLLLLLALPAGHPCARPARVIAPAGSRTQPPSMIACRI